MCFLLFKDINTVYLTCNILYVYIFLLKIKYNIIKTIHSFRRINLFLILFYYRLLGYNVT
jgi:hypothetical protein